MLVPACDMLTPEQETQVLAEVNAQEMEGLLTAAEAEVVRELVAADDTFPWEKILMGALGIGGAYLGINLRGMGGSNAGLLRNVLAQAKKRQTAQDVADAAKPSLLDTNAGQ